MCQQCYQEAQRARADADASPIGDNAWQNLAVSSREALALLGHPIDIQCLPRESQPCGGTYAEHAWCQLHLLRAIIDHHLTHLPHISAKIAVEIYVGTQNELLYCSDPASRQIHKAITQIEPRDHE